MSTEADKRAAALGATIAPLIVKPRDARQLLSCSQKRLYQLLADGELESFKDGSSRKITVASIAAYVNRKLEGARTTS